MIESREALRLSFDVAISMLLVFLILAWCLQLLLPFIGLITWGAVIAVSLHGPFLSLRGRLGNKAAASVFAILGCGLILVPAWLFAESIISPLQGFAQSVQNSSFKLALPSENVKDWPLVGEQVHAAWTEASTDSAAFLSQHAAQLRQLASFGLSKAAGLGLTVLLFVGATLVATALLAKEAEVVQGLRLLFTRLVGTDKSVETLDLTAATVRSVAMGVLGIAFIQGVLAGLGMIAVGVPAAGIWAVAVMVLAIAQLPALIVLLPIILYVFSVESTTVAIVFAIWSILVGISDAFLKPALLGRGVDVPTLVILLGAIGGMITSGLLGLFVGAVVLAIGYKLLLLWLFTGDEPAPQGEPASPEESIQPGAG